MDTQDAMDYARMRRDRGDVGLEVDALLSLVYELDAERNANEVLLSILRENLDNRPRPA